VGENNFQLHIRQRLIARIYSELKKLNSPKINESIRKWGTELNRTFSKEEIQMARKYEKMLTISSHKGSANQSTLRFHLTPVVIAIIRNTTNNKCW
jgi:hypothetical protein